jgi:hypothetical protein
MKNLALPVLLALVSHITLGQIPAITSFSPASGPIGTTVTITGNNFSSTADDNIVYFGATKAMVSAATPTSLTVKVPLGATHHPISVAVNLLVAYSQLPFIVAYSDGGANFDAASFATPINIPGSAFGTAFDIDGNKKVDLLYSLFADDLINVYENATNGGTITFAPLWDQFGASINPQSIKYADLNGDGRLDIMVTSPTQNRIYIYTNVSDPGFSLFYSPVVLVTGTEPRKIGVGDLNNDGKPDIICTNSASHNVSVFKNTSASGVISFDTKQDFATATIPDGIAVGDLSGDGKPDVAVASGGGYLSVLVNSTTTGTITFEPKSDIVVGSIFGIDIGDIDNDGKADLVVCNQGSEVIVFRNTGTTSLSFSTGTSLAATFPSGVILSDLNADGKPDIVITNHSATGGVSVAKNNSTPGFISFASFVTYAVGAGPVTVVAADWDNDGLTDLASFNLLADNISILKNTLNINTTLPQCPQLLSPANGATNINNRLQQQFTWRKAANATGYRVRVIQQSGGYTEVNTTDTTYFFNLLPGTNYTWNVTPLNMADPSLTCPGFSFSTCASAPNTVVITEVGPTTVCRTDSVKIIANSSTNVQWFYYDVPLAGATSNLIQAKWPGNYTLRVLNAGCYSDPSNIVTVTHLPTPVKPSLTPGNDTAFCDGKSVTLTSSINVNNQWFNASTLLAGANGVTYSTSQAGSYYVRVSNSSSGCYNFSDTVEVSILPLPPTAAITPNGNTTICTGESTLLSSSFSNGNQWYKDGILIPGAINQQYSATATGSYTIKRINSATGCESAASPAVAITVNTPPPTPVATAVSGTSFCNGDSAKLRSSLAAGNQWYKNNVLIAGATSQEYFAKEAAAFTIKAAQLGCTSSESNVINTTVQALPAKPVVTSNGLSVSTTAGFTGYQWFFNNAIIAGATAPQYNSTQNGLYKVEVLGANGCKNISDNFNYITTGLNDVTLQGYSIQLYPNPVIDDLTLKVSQGFSSNGTVTVNITDATGRPVKTQSLKNGINTISLKHVAAGSYWILLKNGRTEKAVRILKIN